ncbi:hypothetical protein B0J13DRAFT_612807 [Dactylonectria estremocensis]|uniref:Uncharacterized protein n=1 Tax=Dactylonectria estremocensis TaxID=1079267 RepID=A0A9P9DIZ7_9HYPO|nr:hypothetical protein B0J13DRAFT_612807 [Dactylonectria estremocensis]
MPLRRSAFHVTELATMDPMSGHCNNTPMVNIGSLSYPSHPPPPPPPPFDYMSFCHSTSGFCASYDRARPPWSLNSNSYPNTRGPCHQHPVHGNQVVPFPQWRDARPAIPAPTLPNVGGVTLAAGPKEVSAPMTSSAALWEQGVHKSQLDPGLKCLSKQERMLVTRRKQKVPWDCIHEEYVNLYGSITVDALRMRLSRLKNKHVSVRQALQSKTCSKGTRQSQRNAEPEER